MHGYILPDDFYESVMESTTVGCSNCHTTWNEPVLYVTPKRYNGPLYKYDACDNCYNAENKTWLEKHLDVSLLRKAGM